MARPGGMNDRIQRHRGDNEGLRPSASARTRFGARGIGIFLIVLPILLLSALVAHAAPLRVISLYPGHTDNVVALGGEGLLVGISENDGPDLLPKLPRFSLKAGAESLLALRPDVVLTRGLVERMNPNLSKVLARAGVRVEMLDPPEWDEFADYLRALAGALGLDPEAGVHRLDVLRTEIAGAAEGKRAGRPAPRVFVEAVGRELHTCAPGSWAARLVALAGGVNAAAEAAPLRAGSALGAGARAQNCGRRAGRLPRPAGRDERIHGGGCAPPPLGRGFVRRPRSRDPRERAQPPVVVGAGTGRQTVDRDLLWEVIP